jgi:RNA polymerase sigma factor (sigma-70 family)
MAKDPSLSRVEAAELCIRARDGDRDAADLLVRSVQPWCWKVANQLARSHPPNEADDLAQVGMISVLRAIRYYDPDRASWVTYACASVSQNVYRYAVQEREKARRLTIAIDADLDSHPDEPGELTPEERVGELLERLDPVARAAVVAELAYVKGGPKVRDRARSLGLSPSDTARSATVPAHGFVGTARTQRLAQAA